MKNQKLLLVLLLGMFVTFQSCEKKDFIGIENDVVRNDEVVKTVDPDDWGIHRVFDYEIGDCIPPAINCFDDIVIRPQKNEQNYLYPFMNNGATGVKEYFLSDKYQKLFPELKNHKNYLKKLQSGKYSCITVKKQNKIFCLFGEEKGLTEQNYEFVFVLKYIK